MTLITQFKKGIENQSQYPPLELLVPHKSYAITINPIQETELKVLETRRKMESIILPLFHANVKVYTELSTKNQNVHYHGFITFNNLKQIGLFYININEIKQHCQFEIDHLNQLDQWYPYIIKQCPQMDSLCHYYKIPNILKFKSK